MKISSKRASIMLALFFALPLTAQPSTRRAPLDCSTLPGTSAGERIAACLAALPPSGGTADARTVNAGGVEDITRNVFAGLGGSRPIRLLLGAARYRLTATQVVPSNTTIVGLGHGITMIELYGDTASAFLHPTNTTRVVIEGLRITGSGQRSQAACIVYDEAFENALREVDVMRCRVGILYTDAGKVSASSFSNTITNSRIVQNTAINIEARSLANSLTLYHVAFGGGSPIGISVLNSDDFKIFGGNCEGATVTCIDIDATDTSGTGVFGGYLVSGVHFEGNNAAGGDIRIGKTRGVQGVTITGNHFAAGAGVTAYPVNILRGSSVHLAGNVVTSGYRQGNAPFLGDVANVSSLSNRWGNEQQTLFHGTVVGQVRTLGRDEELFRFDTAGIAFGRTVRAPGYSMKGTSATVTAGTSAPRGRCNPASLYLRTDGAAKTTLYVCEAGTWAAK